MQASSKATNGVLDDFVSTSQVIQCFILDSVKCSAFSGLAWLELRTVNDLQDMVIS